jgi:hypothetical protein
MPQETINLPPGDKNNKTARRSFSSLDVTCTLLNGSVTITIKPKAKIIKNNQEVVEQDTFKLDSSSTSKSFSKITKITIKGKDANNSVNLFS